MDNKFYVSLEAARLLKEKGYNEETIYYYNSAGKLYLGNGHFNYNAYAVNLSAPSKSEAIDWLESKGMLISPIPVTVFCEDGTIERHWRCNIVQNSGAWYSTYDFPTRLEAEEAAIIEALELL